MKPALVLLLVILALGVITLWSLRGITSRAIEERPVESEAVHPAPEALEKAATSAEREAASEDSHVSGRQVVAVEASKALEPKAPASDANVADVTRPVSIRGRLLDESGEPIKALGASVTAQSERGRGAPDCRLVDGAFEFQGLEDGRWSIHGDAPGFAKNQVEVSLSRAAQPLAVDLVLHRRPTVRVLLLTPAGEPFLLATSKSASLPVVYATHSEPSAAAGAEARLHPECGDFIGHEQLGLDPRHLGLLELECEPPIWASLVLGSMVLESQPVGAGVDEIVFHLDPAQFARAFAELRLRVVDRSTRKPVAGAAAQLVGGPWRGEMMQANELGEIKVGEMLSGRGSLMLSSPGYASRSIDVEVQPGTKLDLGDLEIDPVVQGMLHLNLGRPPGVDRVTVSWSHDVETAPTSWSSGFFGADAKPEIGLERGRWLVWAEATADGRSYRSRDLEVSIGSGVVEESLALEPLAAVTFEPAPSERVLTIIDGAARASIRRSYTVRDRPLVVDLVVGEYEMLVRVPGEAERSLPLHVGPEGATVRLE